MADTYGGSQYNASYDPYVLSGVLSHWFYVLTLGETGTNDIGSSYAVSGVGLNKSEEIIAEAVFNNYLDGTTSYPQVRTAMINAAAALYCQNSPEVKAVTDAWYAVGVGSAYGGSTMGIIGVSLLCTSSVNFTLNNAPGGSTISWTATNTTPASGSGNVAGLAAYSGSTSGAGTLTFTVTNSGCSNTMLKTFWVGVPNKSNLLVRDYSTLQVNPQLCLYRNNYLQVFSNSAATEGIDQYGWQFVSGGSFGNPSHDIGVIYPTASTVYYNLRAHNTCGWSTYLNYSSSCMTCSSLMMFTVYPNPATTELLIDITGADENDQLKDHAETSLTLYNTRSTIVKQYIIDLSAGTAKVDISSVPKGHYIAHLQHQDHLEIRHLLIE